jgi:hypothetical protein
MSRRWKVMGATAVLAVLVGGTAWAASGPSRPSAPAGSVPGGSGTRPVGPSALAARGQQWRERISHVTHAAVDVVVGGKPYELTIEHGVLTTIVGDALTVKEADGRIATVAVSPDTKVRLDGQPSSLDALKVGDRVFTLTVGTNPARFVVAFDGAAPAGATGTSGSVDGADQVLAALLGSAA